MHQSGKKRITTIVLILSLLAAMCIAVILIVQYTRGDRIKDLILSELNKHLTAEVTINKVDYELLRSFPNATITINGVAMKPPTGLPDSPGLLHAKNIYLKFSLFDILTGNYNIHSVEIHNASVSLFTNNNGQVNYIFWKQSSGSATDKVRFDFKRIKLVSTDFLYRDTEQDNDLALHINTIVLKGKFRDELIEVNASGTCRNERMIISGEPIIPEGDAEIASELLINTELKNIRFKKSRISLLNVAFAFSGDYTYNSKRNFAFSLDKLEGSVTDILKLVPASLNAKLSKLNAEGTLTLDGNLHGTAQGKMLVYCELNYALKKGKAQLKDKHLLIDDAESSGSLSYAPSKSLQKLVIRTLEGKINKAVFKANGKVVNLTDPIFNASVHLKGDLSEFNNTLQNENFHSFKGLLITDLVIQGKLSSAIEINKAISGQASLAQGSFMYNNRTVENINGNISYSNNSMVLDGIEMATGQSYITTNGKIDNLIGSLLNYKKNVHASLNLSSKKLQLTDILVLIPKQSANTNTSIFPPNISFDVLLSLESLVWNKLNTQALSGKFSLKNDVLTGKDITIDAFGGSITGNGLINGRYGNRAQILTKADFKNVNISDLFYQFNNFGQKSLVSSNIKGTANANVEFSTSLFADYRINISSVQAITDIEIYDGELLNFEPMQALSGFLDAAELRNIKFKTLKNHIEIANRKVSIPLMQIQSSALDLYGYGTHTFGNEIDYHVNLLASDLIRRKNKKVSALNTNVIDDWYGKPRLFLKFSGTIDDPVVQYDTQEVKKKLVTNLKNEKKVFNEVMREEFGKKKGTGQQNSFSSQTKEQLKFDIEWDDEK